MRLARRVWQWLIGGPAPRARRWSTSPKPAYTGVLRRQPFIAQLNAELRSNARGSGLLLVRLRRLAAMNQRLGPAGTDRLLTALAQVLQRYPRRVKGALTGRLNGGDFALYLPAAGLCQETAHSLLQALRGALATVDPQAELAIGALELPPGCSASAALARCDGALVQAESKGAFALSLAPAPPALVAPSAQRNLPDQPMSATCSSKRPVRRSAK